MSLCASSPEPADCSSALSKHRIFARCAYYIYRCWRPPVGLGSDEIICQTCQEGKTMLFRTRQPEATSFATIFFFFFSAARFWRYI